VSRNDRQRQTSQNKKEKMHMQKAHLFEALLMVNQGIDAAVQGLQRLKKKSDLLQEAFAETVARLESDRAQVNVRFFALIEANQQREAENRACYGDA
jgi:hypothetical protein